MMTSAERDARSDASADSSSRAEISRASGTRLCPLALVTLVTHAFSLRLRLSALKSLSCAIANQVMIGAIPSGQT